MIMHPFDLVASRARSLRLNSKGLARRTILELSSDGVHTLAEIEDAILTQHPDLFPSEVEIRRFVRREVGENIE